jgi:acylpyruvate hydrolase
MRLATLATEEGPTAVVVRDDGAVRINGYRDIGELLRDGAGGLQAARAAARTGTAAPLEPARLLRPVLEPGAVVCVGLNYRTHILEMGRDLPAVPTLFSKLPRALTDPYADVELPAASTQWDYEAELAVVLGTGGRNIPRQDAWSHVAGLTILNDVTARDYQRRTIQWFAGKTFQRSTPIGPWIVTPDELGDLSERELRLTVNGEQRQSAALGDLEPGDMIATGTPGGVGEPQGKFIRPGDEVEVSIDGIGAIRSSFREARA